MVQRRIFNYKEDDSTFLLNQKLIEIVRPGLYFGYDAVFETGLILKLNHATTGETSVDVNEIESAKRGIVISRQGVVVKDEDEIQLPISIGNSLPRIDIIIMQHQFVEIEGGNPATYVVKKGTPNANPVVPVLDNPIRQIALGYLYVPANMSSVDEVGVVYERQDNIEFGGKDDKLYKANNLSDLLDIVSARNNLDLGDHVTYNFGNSSSVYGTENSIARGDHLVDFTSKHRGFIDSFRQNNVDVFIVNGCSPVIDYINKKILNISPGTIIANGIISNVLDHVPSGTGSKLYWNSYKLNQSDDEFLLRTVYADSKPVDVPSSDLYYFNYSSNDKISRVYKAVWGGITASNSESGWGKGNISFEQNGSVDGEYKILAFGSELITYVQQTGDTLANEYIVRVGTYSKTVGVKPLTAFFSGTALAEFLGIFFYNLADGLGAEPVRFWIEIETRLI